MPKTLIAGSVIVLGGVVGILILRHAAPPRLATPARPSDERPVTGPPAVPPETDSSPHGNSRSSQEEWPPRIVPPKVMNPIDPSRLVLPARPAAQIPTPTSSNDPVPATDPEPVVPLPIARSALGWVGADPSAELIWAQAINDPNTPADARKDLIEDLNQEGFPDPKNLTEDDVPLILSRLDLIEQLGPDSMDEVNAAAFDEAYKDLLKMLEKAMQQ